MKNLFLFSIFAIFYSFNVNGAVDCLGYKLIPDVKISAPDWTKSVVQPRRPMNLLHGDVVATLTDNYEIVVDVNPVENGYCVALKNVDAVVGYSDFLVQIDIHHAPNTCSYNAILSHEDEHISAYLSVISDLQDELQSAVFSAADSIMPIYVSDSSEIDKIIDSINAELQSHPDLILIKQRIAAAQEIKNKHVDQNDTGARLKMCF